MLPLALLGLPNAILGGYQTYQAMKGLNALNDQPAPNYTVSPELQNSYNRAEGLSGKGFTGTEEASFKNNLASENAASQYAAQQQAGGNLGQNIFAGIQSRNLGALNKYAADDAGLHRENIKYADSIGQSIQQQKNMATNTDIQRRFQKEQAYGGALKAGTENLVGGINYGAAMIAPELNQLGGGMANPFSGIAPKQSELSTENLDALTPEQASQLFPTLPPGQQQYLQKRLASQTSNIG